MEYEPKISVIIPAYNAEEFIEVAIHSILNQSYKNIELLIVNDGSTDETLSVIRKYEYDRRVSIIDQNNSGVSEARNKALDVATGAYCMFLDSDDWIGTDVVEHMVRAICDLSRKNPGKELLLAQNCTFIDEDKNKKENRISKINRGLNQRVLSSESALLEVGTSKYILQSVWAKMFSLSVIKKHNLRFNIELSNGEDGLFVFQYLNKADGLLYISQDDWFISVRTGSVTRSGFNEKLNTGLIAIEEMLRNVPQSNTLLKEALEVFLVEKTISLEFKMLQSDFNSKKILDEYRIRLRKYGSVYLRNNKAKKKMVWLLMTFSPCIVCKWICKYKGKRSDANN